MDVEEEWMVLDVESALREQDEKNTKIVPDEQQQPTLDVNDYCRFCGEPVRISGQIHHVKNIFENKGKKDRTIFERLRGLGLTLSRRGDRSFRSCVKCDTKVNRLVGVLPDFRRWEQAEKVSDRPAAPVAAAAAVSSSSGQSTPDDSATASAPLGSDRPSESNPALPSSPGTGDLETAPPSPPPQPPPGPDPGHASSSNARRSVTQVIMQFPSKTITKVSPPEEAGIVTNISTQKWKTAAKQILNHKELAAEVKEQILHLIDGECKALCKHDNGCMLLSTEAGDLTSFPFELLESDLRRLSPLLLSVLSTVTRGSRPVTCAAAAIAVRGRENRMSAFAYHINSILQYGGGKKAVLERLSKMAITTTYAAAAAKQKQTANAGGDAVRVLKLLDAGEYRMEQGPSDVEGVVPGLERDQMNSFQSFGVLENLSPDHQEWRSSLVQEERQRSGEDDGSTLTVSAVQSDDEVDEGRETEPLASTSTQHINTQAGNNSGTDHNDGKTKEEDQHTPATSHNKAQHAKQAWSLSNKLSQDLQTSTDHTRSPHTGEKTITCFSQKSHLMYHMRTHTGTTKPLTCKVCKKSFSAVSSLWTHMRMHTGGFACTVCGKGFSKSEALEAHVASHTGGEKSFTCNVCDKAFGQKWHLTIHMRAHVGEKPFICGVCGKSLSKWSSLKIHMRSHTGEKPYTCKVCGKGFGLGSSLRVHMKTHTGEKPFTCEVCGKCFRQKGALTHHMRTHTGEKPFICEVCGKCFRQKGALNHHMRTHTGEKSFDCTVCNERFAAAGLLKIHMKTHKGLTPFPCTVCGKSFALKYLLKRHMRCHTDGKPFTCKVCGKGFRISNHLSEHMVTHTGERPFTCEICSKRFCLKSNLTRHVKIHTGEKPFICKVCNNSFSQAGSLKTHMQTAHTLMGEKPFTCNVCSKGFSQKKYLKVHMRTHTGEKPFTCNVCGNGFSQKTNLDYHMRTHTGEKPFPCTVCGLCFRRKTRLTTHMMSHAAEEPV